MTKITPKEGFFFKNKYNGFISSDAFIGEVKIVINEEVKTVVLTEDDFIEVYPVVVDNINYYVSSTTYPELVTELIRQKYTLDDELALMANSRIGDNKYEMEFQNWRKLCKEAAKRVLNE